MLKKFIKAWLIAVLLACLVPTGAMADTLMAYFNNFDEAPTVAPGVSAALSGVTTTVGVQGYAGLGPLGNQFGGDFLINTSTGNPAQYTTLTLNGLPAHTSVNVNFLLAAIDSWDGYNGASWAAPDYLNVMVDGNTVFVHAFAITSGDTDYSPPTGVLLSSGSNLGFWDLQNDNAYNMYLEPAFQNIAHTGNSLTISWFASGAGWQGGTDESWAIENVRVDLVPLPPTVVLLGSGLLGLLGAGWRLRKP
jgi:hypothetical protein